MKESTQLNGKVWAFDTVKNFLVFGSKFDPELSLAYLMYEEKILVGAAIIHVTCALSVAPPLVDFINGEKPLDKLNIGMGVVTFDPENENLHHNVKKVIPLHLTGTSEEKDLAIVFVSFCL